MANPSDFYRRHLPHWQPAGASFFVTFRLKGTLPAEVVKSLRDEMEAEKRPLGTPAAGGQAKQRDPDRHSFFRRWYALQDKPATEHSWLSRSDIAEIVMEALHYRDGREYELYCFCVMPNHVHTVFKPLERPPTKILQSLKRHTARTRISLLAGKGRSGRMKVTTM